MEDNIPQNQNVSKVQAINNNSGVNPKDNSSEQNLQNQLNNNSSNEDMI